MAKISNKIRAYSSETSDYHPHLIHRLQETFPGCTILKNDPNVLQGVEDFVILYKNKWATLEAKIDEKSRKNPQPNQEFYVAKHNEMSFSRFVYPAIEDKVFAELEKHFYE